MGRLFSEEQGQGHTSSLFPDASAVLAYAFRKQNSAEEWWFTDIMILAFSTIFVEASPLQASHLTPEPLHNRVVPFVSCPFTGTSGVDPAFEDAISKSAIF